MPQDAAHDLPDEVPEARQKQPESGPTQLVNGQLTPNKRPISDGTARAHVRQRSCTNRSSCNNAVNRDVRMATRSRAPDNPTFYGPAPRGNVPPHLVYERDNYRFARHAPAVGRLWAWRCAGGRFLGGILGGSAGRCSRPSVLKSTILDTGGRTRAPPPPSGHGRASTTSMLRASASTNARPTGPAPALLVRPPATQGVVARILTGPHDANRQDSHLPMRYDTGRPRAVIRLRISQPRTTSLPCPAGLRARRPSPMMDL